MTATLANLATIAVSSYISECGNLVAPTLSGLLSTEAANERTWADDGYAWADVREALKAAWAAL